MKSELVIGAGDAAQFIGADGVWLFGNEQRSWLARLFDWRWGRRPWHSHHFVVKRQGFILDD